MPRCPDCGHEWQGDLAKGASIVKDAIRHPVKALKNAFTKKPEYPMNCNRNCDGKILDNIRKILSAIVPQEESTSASGDILYTFKIFKSVWDKLDI